MKSQAASTQQTSPAEVVKELGRQDPVIHAEVQSLGKGLDVAFRSKLRSELDKVIGLVVLVFACQ